MVISNETNLDNGFEDHSKPSLTINISQIQALKLLIGEGDIVHRIKDHKLTVRELHGLTIGQPKTTFITNLLGQGKTPTSSTSLLSTYTWSTNTCGNTCIRTQ